MSGKRKKLTKREASLHEAATDLKRLDKTLNAVHSTNGKRYLIGQYMQDLLGLVGFMDAVIYGDGLPYQIESGPTKKEVRVVSKGLAKDIQNLHGYFALYSADLAYAPQLVLFFEYFLKHPVYQLNPFSCNSMLGDGRLDAEIANEFVTYLREQGKQQKIKKKIDDWMRNTYENQDRIKAYVPALFDAHARLMVVRIDLSYRKAMVDEQDVMLISDKLLALAATDVKCLKNGESIEKVMDRRETLARIDIVEAKKDLEHLFRNMRGKPSLFEHLFGFVWSIEFSRVGGYHVHVALFFDGSKVQKDAWYADEIGKYWSEVITKGRGLYFNCNRNREAYGNNWAIGMIDHYDTKKREKLMRVLDYLAKDSQPVYVKPTANGKMFGTGHLPGEKRAGRPRKK